MYALCTLYPGVTALGNCSAFYCESIIVNVDMGAELGDMVGRWNSGQEESGIYLRRNTPTRFVRQIMCSAEVNRQR